MLIESVWLTKLLLSHLLTDFLLQPKNWIDDRKKKHFRSGKLYMHGFITALSAFILIGRHYWQIAIIIFLTHILIDGWKSFKKETLSYFLIDQTMHITVIIGCWYFTFLNPDHIWSAWQFLNTNASFWLTSAAFVFITMPAGILIGQLTKQWRDQIEGAESLANAGKWIGMVERVIILIFVLLSQYAAIGLLVAAKGIIRFNEKDRPEVKTEYLVIGTLLSIVLALLAGLLVNIITPG